MSVMNVSCKILQGVAGAKDVQIEVRTDDGMCCFAWVMNGASCRNVAGILLGAAKEAESVIHLPAHDSRRVPGA